MNPQNNPRVSGPRGARRFSNQVPSSGSESSINTFNNTSSDQLLAANSDEGVYQNQMSQMNQQQIPYPPPSVVNGYMPEMTMPSPMLHSGMESPNMRYSQQPPSQMQSPSVVMPRSPRAGGFSQQAPLSSPTFRQQNNSPVMVSRNNNGQVMFTLPTNSVMTPNGNVLSLPSHELASGAAPMRRRKTVKQNIELKGGRLVVDIPVPEKILSFGKHREGQEFTHLRYTAATCDPDDFATEGYSLRAAQYGRTTELFVVVTMYNEDEHLLTKTMTSVFKNIAHLCSRSRSKTWGPDGWKKVVVCIVSDGRKKINPRVLTVLGIMGCYQDGIMKNTVNGKEVAAHIFEYTTQVCVDQELKVRGEEKGVVPVQMIFCLKEKNQKKINSHRWFFNAFGTVLQPKVCSLIDVGTRPYGTSLYYLWKAFENDSRVGGACGEIKAELGSGCKNLVNPLVAAQNFEYKMSNILDKPLESVFGFISVLPGAFSAYRFKALQDSYPGVGPLSSYFLGEKMHTGSDVFSANMYLAEDRILCFELVTKRNESWLLRYVKAAKAETDVPDNVPEFISQRRRWLNGSFFAGVHALTHFLYLFRTNHSIFRKMFILVEFFYNLFNVLFNWFGMANFYLAFYFLGLAATDTSNGKGLFQTGPPTGSGSSDASDNNSPGRITFNIVTYIYLIVLVTTFIISMGNRPQGSKTIYLIIFVVFALIMAFLSVLAGWTVYEQVNTTINDLKNNDNGSSVVSYLFQTPAFRDIVLSLAATYGIYLVSSLLYLDFAHVATSMIQYLFLLPSFINVLMIYAFSNLHDVSWGTKGDNAASTDLGEVIAKTGKDGKQIVEIELPTERQDIDAEYDRLLIELRNRPQVQKQKRDAKTKQEDYFKNFRTRVLLWWMLSNLILVMVMTNDRILDLMKDDSSSSYFNPYLSFIMWSVTGINFVRFIGSVWYLIDNFLWA